MGKQRTIPGAVQQTELPIGFSLVYNDAQGARGTGLRLSTDINADEARTKQYLYEAFEGLCNAMDPTRVHRKRIMLEKRAKQNPDTTLEQRVRETLHPPSDHELESIGGNYDPPAGA